MALYVYHQCAQIDLLVLISCSDQTFVLYEYVRTQPNTRLDPNRHTYDSIFFKKHVEGGRTWVEVKIWPSSGLLVAGGVGMHLLKAWLG